MALPCCRFLFAQDPRGSYRRPADEVLENAAAADGGGGGGGEAAAEEEEAGEEEEEVLELEKGLPYCAHCWRYAYGLSMRPGATGVEQMWEQPIEEGSYALVQDFANVEALDSPLLSLEELGRDVLNTRELHTGLTRSGYVLEAGSNASGAMTEAGAYENQLETEVFNTKMADLLSSGYADHILSLVLFACGINDAQLALLSRALVGNCLFLQYLDLSENLFGGEGIEAFAAQLLAPKRTLMLPCLRCLDLSSLPPHFDLDAGFDETEARPAMDRGLYALADAVRDFALPGLEALILHLNLHDPLLHGVFGEEVEELIPGLNRLLEACDERSIGVDGQLPE